MLIKRLCTAKYLYLHACKLVSKPNPLTSGIAVSLFQDAIELVLWNICNEISADLKSSAGFMAMVDKIKDAPGNKEKKHVKNKNRIEVINKLRIAFKHNGILPDTSEIHSSMLDAENILTDLMNDFLDIDFYSLSLSDQIQDYEIHKLLKDAEELAVKDDYNSASIKISHSLKLLNNKISYYIDKPDSDIKKIGSYFNENNEYEVNSIFDRLYEYLSDTRTILVLNKFGMDILEYKKMISLLPYISISQSGKIQSRTTGHIISTKEEYDFCINYIVHYALNVEAEF